MVCAAGEGGQKENDRNYRQQGQNAARVCLEKVFVQKRKNMCIYRRRTLKGNENGQDATKDNDTRLQ